MLRTSQSWWVTYWIIAISSAAFHIFPGESWAYVYDSWPGLRSSSRFLRHPLHWEQPIAREHRAQPVALRTFFRTSRGASSPPSRRRQACGMVCTITGRRDGGTPVEQHRHTKTTGQVLERLAGKAGELKTRKAGGCARQAKGAAWARHQTRDRQWQVGANRPAAFDATHRRKR